MEKFQSKDYLKSTDLQLVAYLQTQQIVVDSFEKSPKGETIFHIRRTDNLDKLTQLYYSNQALVNPNLYNHYLRSLKSQIYHT